MYLISLIRYDTSGFGLCSEPDLMFRWSATSLDQTEEFIQDIVTKFGFKGNTCDGWYTQVVTNKELGLSYEYVLDYERLDRVDEFDNLDELLTLLDK